MQKLSRLTPSTLLFPMALVLFEFAVYIANDMIQPGMLAVTREFGADASWVPSAMTAFLLGGAVLSWLVGPVSDRVGRRPVMLGGVVFFIAACLATFLCRSIESFTLLRVLQGMGLCFISAVGYATIQEAYEEKAAVKVTALMANVALIAPLVGPVAGAAMIEVLPWRASFVFIAVLSAIAFAGLVSSMPETVAPDRAREPLGKMLTDYVQVFSNRRFVASALCIPLLALPMLGWIALSPLMLVENAGLTTLQYGLCQIPVFGSLILGNLLLVRVADRWPLGHSVKVGSVPVIGGMLLMSAGTLLTNHDAVFLVTGMCLMALGEGLAFAVLYRFALMASPVAKGTVSAAMTIISMVAYAAGIEALKHAWLAAGVAGFAVLALVISVVFRLVSRPLVKVAMAERETGGNVAADAA
ncbi:MFS transporter [Paludibacterium paludis]|uniref:Multidrug transporter MdfA n=1 Tax=Paludibacterium paludis TaxID=1225769 RepID=A0A918U6R7_9NEIS|nr:MFS transporter [Paludibacterium paludis]GGY03973.1 multidrug transporter MdfA [Paludibacterium paludis]